MITTINATQVAIIELEDIVYQYSSNDKVIYLEAGHQYTIVTEDNSVTKLELVYDTQ